MEKEDESWLSEQGFTQNYENNWVYNTKEYGAWQDVMDTHTIYFNIEIHEREGEKVAYVFMVKTDLVHECESSLWIIRTTSRDVRDAVARARESLKNFLRDATGQLEDSRC